MVTQKKIGISDSFFFPVMKALFGWLEKWLMLMLICCKRKTLLFR